MKLSTRPEQFVGDVTTWEAAEKALGAALQQFLVATHKADGSRSENTFEVDVGGGAFYGPKVDVFVKDAIGREHQCATVQLDFQLPRRFDLEYVAPDGAKRTPVIIHRAILGSVERMLGILIEHTAGKWPFWLSPRQVLICSVNDRNTAYAEQTAATLRHCLMQSSVLTPAATPAASATITFEADSEMHIDVDGTSRTIPKKVREGQVAQYNLIGVAGDAEEAAGTLTLRFRDEATWQAFHASWLHVQPDAQVPTSNVHAAAGASEAGAASAAALPIVTLPVATVRAVCEHIMRTV